MRPWSWLLVEIAMAVTVFAILVTRVPTVEHFLANPDHGYQLAAGAELLRGRIPGLDFVINYGPLVAVLAAATLRPSGTLVIEVLVCAAAWAVAIWLAFRLTRRSFGVPAALAAALYAYVCIPRFHKWYIWLVPLAALAAIDISAARTSRGRWLASGVVCGLGALLRPDLGIAVLAVLSLLALADALHERGLAWPDGWLPLALGFVLPALAWAAALVTAAGPAGLVRAVMVIPESVAGTLSSLAKAPPPFRLDDPFSPESAHALALFLLPAVEITALVVGTWLFRGDVLHREGRALIALGLMGLGCYHHTVYRADIHHLWQGIWPIALVVPALAAVAARLAPARKPAAALVAAAAAAFAVAATAGLASILRLPHYDLAPYGRPPLAGLRALADGIDAAPDHPYAQLVRTIDRYTAPSDEVLVLVYGPQLLVFAHRGASGPAVTFQAGLFDSPAWRARRLAALQRNPPALVVVPLRFFQLEPDEDVRGSLPEVYDFVRTHYQQLVDRRGNFMLLAPDASFRPPSS